MYTCFGWCSKSWLFVGQCTANHERMYTNILDAHGLGNLGGAETAIKESSGVANLARYE